LRYSEFLKDIPWQKIHDTPTVKHYTDWDVYDKFLDLEYATTVEPQHIPETVAELPNVVILKPYEALTLCEDKHVSIRYELREGRLYKDELKDLTKALANHQVRNALKVDVLVEESLANPLVMLVTSGNGYVGYDLNLRVSDGVNADVVLMDFIGGLNTFKSSIMNFTLGVNSKVGLTFILSHGLGGPSYGVKNVNLESGSELEVEYLGKGGLMSREELNVKMSGANSLLKLRASLIAPDRTSIDLITNALHLGRNTQSEVQVRGLALGRSKVIHRGVGKILESAASSSTNIETKIIVLSDEGVGYANPSLEVGTGDVKQARHSASVSQIDENALFYLMSRGLSKADVVELYVNSLMDAVPKAKKYLDLMPDLIKV